MTASESPWVFRCRSVIPAGPMLRFRARTRKRFTDRLAEELEATILEADPETIGAMIAEPVSVSSGMFPPPASYFPKITRVLKKYGIQLFIDEVVTGFGRSGRMWATEAMGLEPDCMTCAKGISGCLYADRRHHHGRGIQPAHSTLAMKPRAGLPMAPLITRMSFLPLWRLKCSNIFDERDILGHVRRMMPHWNRMLDSLLDHPLVDGQQEVGAGRRGRSCLSGRRPGRAAASLKVGGVPRMSTRRVWWKA